MVRACLILPAFAVGLVTPSLAQSTLDDAVLAGVDSVNARISLTWDSNIAGHSEHTVRSRLQTVFELELRKHGITVSREAPGFLSMGLVVLNARPGGIAYSYELELWEFGLPNRAVTTLILNASAEADSSLHANPFFTFGKTRGQIDHELQAAKWERFFDAWLNIETGAVVTWTPPGGVSYVSSSNLLGGLEETVIEMAQKFVNAYLASHPAR